MEEIFTYPNDVFVDCLVVFDGTVALSAYFVGM
jgi:hypothetical protein